MPGLKNCYIFEYSEPCCTPPALHQINRNEHFAVWNKNSSVRMIYMCKCQVYLLSLFTATIDARARWAFPTKCCFGCICIEAKHDMYQCANNIFIYYCNNVYIFYEYVVCSALNQTHTKVSNVMCLSLCSTLLYLPPASLVSLVSQYILCWAAKEIANQL